MSHGLEEICANHMSKKGLISRIYKNQLHFKIRGQGMGEKQEGGGGAD